MSTLSRRDRLIPWYFVLFFVVIATVDGVMVTLAVRTHTGIVTEHPYEKGLAYNQVVAAANAQEKLGWKSDIAYRDGTLHFTLNDRTGAPLHPQKAAATFTRPTQAGHDFTVTLQGTDTPVTLPEPGLWEVRIDTTTQDVHYQKTQRIVAQ